eukprot:746841-Hanusia_phi.AAC.1
MPGVNRLSQALLYNCHVLEKIILHENDLNGDLSSFLNFLSHATNLKTLGLRGSTRYPCVSFAYFMCPCRNMLEPSNLSGVIFTNDQSLSTSLSAYLTYSLPFYDFSFLSLSISISDTLSVYPAFARIPHFADTLLQQLDRIIPNLRHLQTFDVLEMYMLNPTYFAWQVVLYLLCSSLISSPILAVNSLISSRCREVLKQRKPSTCHIMCLRESSSMSDYGPYPLIYPPLRKTEEHHDMINYLWTWRFPKTVDPNQTEWGNSGGSESDSSFDSRGNGVRTAEWKGSESDSDDWNRPEAASGSGAAAGSVRVTVNAAADR